MKINELPCKAKTYLCGANLPTSQVIDLKFSQKNPIKHLNAIKNSHHIWSNQLLQDCENGLLSLTDFKFLFTQYYYYSRNFTKLLAAAMIKCDSDYYRSKLSENLWEEGGGQEVELRHAEIFRKFLKESLKISLDTVIFEHYSQYFFNQYLQNCLNADPAACMAMLSFATEGIVARLYTIFKKGLLKAGLTEQEVTFFNIHIECDDDHAQTLEEMALSYSKEEGWLKKCEQAIITTLNLREQFFSNIYKSLQLNNLTSLIATITSPNSAVENKLRHLTSNLNNLNVNLYQNDDTEKSIRFSVDRVPFNADVLDPRIVTIPPGYSNELHRHAHETVILGITGSGEVVIDNQVIPLHAGNIVYVPRWSKHQTRNTGNQDLKFFAVTDFGLTKRFRQNSETSYRLKANA